ncbi:MAG: ABC-F family ATP-binding cassette domain-containing protein [Candidatus Abawacabacteria bacterium]|nr:ABC-F family ATP-binding cassette domain-containing protein [Candidatus Abawacabacteria bacterium]
MAQETIVSFDTVSFEFENEHQILVEASFSVRRGSKITIMGQNGAGKSTIFKLICSNYRPNEGMVNIVPGLTIAIAPQVTPLEDRDLTVKAFFEKYLHEKAYDIDRRIDDVLAVVNLHAPHDRIIKSFSGGQQARLLLASALIQDPDLLLLDEPTNNLDHAGIDHLTDFIINYPKTCIVISHDADFLNAFTDGVLYLDVFTKQVEQYVGNYFDVVQQIEVRKQKENSKNAQLAKGIQEKRDKANVFAHKGGKMRAVAKRMRKVADELEDDIVEVRKEDKTIRSFIIPCQEDLAGEIVKINAFTIIQDHKPIVKKASLVVRKNQHLLLTGPNGIGKSTLLENLATGKAKDAIIGANVRVGYYRQDFSTLNFAHTVHQSLMEALESSAGKPIEEHLRSTAAGFLITSAIINSKIGTLSEGQKGLVSFARLVLQRPGLLILDEPTNHINFRHLPVIAQALDEYTGAMILVSHVPDFVAQIRIDDELDLTK